MSRTDGLRIEITRSPDYEVTGEVRAAIENLASALAEEAEQSAEVSGFSAPRLPGGGTDFMKLTPVLGPKTQQLFCLGIHFKDDDGGDHCGGLFVD